MTYDYVLVYEVFGPHLCDGYDWKSEVKFFLESRLQYWAFYYSKMKTDTANYRNVHLFKLTELGEHV